MEHLLFVYGTLKDGYYNHDYWMEGTKFYNYSSVKGYKLLDLGAFPGMVKGDEDDQVFGEVYGVTQAQLERIHHLEGYTKGREDTNLYNLEQVTDVYGATMYTYIFNAEDQYMDMYRVLQEW